MPLPLLYFPPWFDFTAGGITPVIVHDLKGPVFWQNKEKSIKCPTLGVIRAQKCGRVVVD